MKKILVFCFLVGMTFFITGCSSNDEEVSPVLYTVNSFEEDEEGWVGEFADYTRGLEDSLDLSFGFGTFTPSLFVGELTALKQTGNATNSDLFMFIKKRVAGFEPNKTYSVIYDIEFHAQLIDDYSGDLSNENLGSFMKIGAFTEEPKVKYVQNTEGELVDSEYVVSTFDIGATESEGSDVLNLGKITYTEVDQSPPTILYAFNEEIPIYVKTDADGMLWLMIGVDSNIPVYQSIYYSNIHVAYQKVDQVN